MSGDTHVAVDIEGRIAPIPPDCGRIDRHGQTATGRNQAPCPAPLSRHPADRGRGGALRATLAAALGAADVAAVLLRLSRPTSATLINRVKALAPRRAAEGRGADARRPCRTSSARAGADGAHLTGIEAFMAAVDSLKPDADRRLRRPATPATTPCSPPSAAPTT